MAEYFCDRVKETDELIRLVKNGNNVVLVSQRRLGKTGLIQHCFDNKVLKKNYWTVYVDILSTTNLREFTFLLGKEVFDSIRSKGEKRWKSFLTIVKSLAGKIGFDPLSGLPVLNLQLGDLVQPEYTLKEIFDYVSKAEKPCVIAIDEFQQISHYPENNVEALLRSHLLRINNCRMIFSGSERHVLANMFVSSGRPFYHSASFMELAPIPKDIYVEFIVDMFRKFDKEISKEIAGRIYDLFDGITYYIQRVCNGTFANTAKGGAVTEEIFEYTLQEILYSFDTIFRMRLSMLTTRQKELLFAVAKERGVKRITSAEFIHRHSLASASAVQTALKSLMKEGLIVQTESGYLPEDRFFTLWLNRNF